MAPAQVRYRSTRGCVEGLTFEEAVFMGLAPDGGLMVPDYVPDASSVYKSWKDLSFADLAYEITCLYCGEDEIPRKDLRALMHRSYSTFAHEEVVPTKKVGDLHIMELFHGPTFAFKDIALQALGNLYEYFLKRNKRVLTVVGATSGDTGSAAIYGLRGKENVECFILFPENRVSPIQQQQMTSVLDDNVHCVAIKGTFDDCQDIVKDLFGEKDFKAEYGLGAVNSINWARIMFQITYYFYTYFKLCPSCDGTMSFSVPTGNFGDILAGYYAKRMGLPVKNLVVATNSNDILHRFFASGVYEKQDVLQTCSPSMDIGISSNFERYLFYLFDEKSNVCLEKMTGFKSSGKLSVDQQQLARARSVFTSGKASESEIQETIRSYEKNFKYVLDPHTACGVAAANQLRDTLRWPGAPNHSMVVLGTAHPAKFGDAVMKAIGRQPDMPEFLGRCKTAPSRFDVLPNSTQKVRQHIEALVKKNKMQGATTSTCLSGLRRLLFCC